MLMEMERSSGKVKIDNMRTDSLDVSTGFDYANMHTAHGIGLNWKLRKMEKL